MTDSVLHSTVPLTSPISTLADRFEAWKDVCSELVRHFKSISDAEVTHNDHLRKIKDTLADPLSPYEGFERGGSVHGVGQLLFEQQAGRVTHSDHIVTALDKEIIPELERARDLIADKIAEIKDLEPSFKTSLARDLETSRHAILDLQDSITSWEAQSGSVDYRRDPFVVDLATRKHLRQSLGEEAFLRESTLNVEQSSKELEQQVVAALQATLGKYNALVSREAAELATMSQKIEDSLLAGHLHTEWEHFRKQKVHEGILIDASSSQRSLENASYQGKDHVSTMPICDGWLEKKSTLLGKYTTSFYIISPSRFLHEFSSNDLRVDTEPTFSLYLPDCELGSTSKEDDKTHKFVLRGKQLGGLHSEHNWTFRAKSRSDMLTWYTNLGRAADKLFQFNAPASQASDGALAAGAASVARANTISARAVQPAPRIQLDADDAADAEPYRGPESLAQTTVQPQTRPAAGRFNSAVGFASPLAAVAASLHAPPISTKEIQPGVVHAEQTRTATSSYGAHEAVAVPATPVHGSDQAQFVRQASIHSAAAGFIHSKEILDDNAHLPYDSEHATHSTLPGDEDFKPADADVAPTRSLTSGSEPAKPRRQASLAFREVAGSPASAVAVASPAGSIRKQRPAVKTPSRQATASYGDPSAVPPLKEVDETNTASFEDLKPTPAPYVSPYFPAPGAGTTGKLPSAQFEQALATAKAPTSSGVSVVQPTRAGSISGVSAGAGQTPSRRMSLSDQILGHSSEHLPAANAGSGVPTLADYDAAPHMRIGTQPNDARYKVPSRRQSRSGSGYASPAPQQEGAGFEHAGLDAGPLAAKLQQVPRRGPPSRGSSLSLGGTGAATPGEDAGLLGTIAESFEKDLAAARGNQKNDTHVPGEYPKTPAEEKERVLPSY